MRLCLPRRLGPRTGLALCLLFVLPGCTGAGNAEAANVQAAAAEFVGSLSGKVETACGLLAPETLRAFEDSEGRCAGALTDTVAERSASVESVQVYGRDAVVHLSTDTLFLARFSRGWLVTAAGCTSQGDRPYDCQVRGE